MPSIILTSTEIPPFSCSETSIFLPLILIMGYSKSFAVSFILFPSHFLIPLIILSEFPTGRAVDPGGIQAEAINIEAVAKLNLYDDGSVIVHGMLEEFSGPAFRSLRHNPCDDDDDDDEKVMKNDDKGLREKEDLMRMVVYVVIVAIFLGYPQAGLLLIVVWFFIPSGLCTCRI